ncbi:MAG: DMT family transporter [Chloroflexota bacterium]|nr:DMT family transporter [Chloroflexota bacterium]
MHSSPPPRAVILATLACVVAAFCWGLSAVIAKGAFERGLSPERMAESRVVVALVPLAAYLLLRRRDLLRPPRSVRPALFVFGLAIVAVNFSYYLAIDLLDVGVAISLQYTAPVLVLVGTALVAREAPGVLAWVAAGLTLIGAVLVSGAYAGLASVNGIGLAAGIAAAITYGTYLVSAEAAGRRGTHPATSLFIGFVVAAVIWSVALPWWDWPVERLTDPQVSLRVLGVGLLGTLIPFLLAVAALRVISAAVAAIASSTEPVFASGLAWLLLGQELSVLQLLGGALIVTAIMIAQLRRLPAPAAAPVEVAP